MRISIRLKLDGQSSTIFQVFLSSRPSIELNLAAKLTFYSIQNKALQADTRRHDRFDPLDFQIGAACCEFEVAKYTLTAQSSYSGQKREVEKIGTN